MRLIAGAVLDAGGEVIGRLCPTYFPIASRRLVV